MDGSPSLQTLYNNRKDPLGILESNYLQGSKYYNELIIYRGIHFPNQFDFDIA